jgi:hypothetical protein
MRSLAGHLLVERYPAAKHAVEDIGRDSAGGEARHFGLQQGVRSGHSLLLATEWGAGATVVCKSFIGRAENMLARIASICICS